MVVLFVFFSLLFGMTFAANAQMYYYYNRMSNRDNLGYSITHDSGLLAYGLMDFASATPVQTAFQPNALNLNQNFSSKIEEKQLISVGVSHPFTMGWSKSAVYLYSLDSRWQLEFFVTSQTISSLIYSETNPVQLSGMMTNEHTINPSFQAVGIAENMASISTKLREGNMSTQYYTQLFERSISFSENRSPSPWIEVIRINSLFGAESVAIDSTTNTIAIGFPSRSSVVLLSINKAQYSNPIDWLSIEYTTPNDKKWKIVKILEFPENAMPSFGFSIAMDQHVTAIGAPKAFNDRGALFVINTQTLDFICFRTIDQAAKLGWSVDVSSNFDSTFVVSGMPGIEKVFTLRLLVDPDTNDRHCFVGNSKQNNQDYFQFFSGLLAPHMIVNGFRIGLGEDSHWTGYSVSLSNEVLFFGAPFAPTYDNNGQTHAPGRLYISHFCFPNRFNYQNYNQITYSNIQCQNCPDGYTSVGGLNRPCAICSNWPTKPINSVWVKSKGCVWECKPGYVEPDCVCSNEDCSYWSPKCPADSILTKSSGKIDLEVIRSQNPAEFCSWKIAPYMKQREVEKALEYLREYDTVRSKDSINFIEKWKNNAEKELEADAFIKLEISWYLNPGEQIRIFQGLTYHQSNSSISTLVRTITSQDFSQWATFTVRSSSITIVFVPSNVRSMAKDTKEPYFSIEYSKRGTFSNTTAYVMVSVIGVFCILTCSMLFRDRSRLIPVDNDNATGRDAGQNLIAKLTMHAYDPNHHNLLDTTCSICLIEIEEGEMIRQLSCRHAFHQPCVDEWLLINTICPLCKRAPIPEESTIMSDSSADNRRNASQTE